MNQVPRLFASVLLFVVTATIGGSAGQRPVASQPLLGASLDPAHWADSFFDDGRLHEIRLAINVRDWEALKEHYLENTYYPTDFRWGDQVVRNVGIRSRGTGSRSGSKPGLRVDFDRYTTDQRFLGLKSVILRNQTQDASGLHERLSMLLFRRMQIPASREAHTRLFINDEYQGLYSIVESIDKSFLTRTFGENDGHLFEYTYPPTASPYRFEDRGPDPAMYVPLPFKPQTHESNPRPEFIVQLVDAINNAGAGAFRLAIEEYLDLAAFLRHVAVEAFLADDDGILGDYGMNNFYFYRFEDQAKFTFIAWDKSNAFIGGPNRSIWRNISDVPGELRNMLMDRTMAYPDLYELYLDYLVECARIADERLPDDPSGPGWLEREIQRQHDQIREAALSDPSAPFTAQEFEAAVSELVTFARTRGDYVRAEVEVSRLPALRGRRFAVPRRR